MEEVVALRFILEHWLKVESVPVGGSVLSITTTIVCERGRPFSPSAAFARNAARLKGCTSNWLAGGV